MSAFHHSHHIILSFLFRRERKGSDNDKSDSSLAPERGLTFDKLVGAIGDIHHRMAAQAGRAVNMSLTVRNWLIGYYIEECERAGVDRARDGKGLMDKLAVELEGIGFTGCKLRELYRYRSFYLTCHQIVGSVTPLFGAAEAGLMAQVDVGLVI